MKKILIVLTIIGILIGAGIYIQSLPDKIILYVQQSNFDSKANIWVSEVLDENGDYYVIESYDNITGQWLNADINRAGEITGCKLLGYKE